MCLEETPCAHPGCPRTTYTHLTDFCSTPDCNIILQSHAPTTVLCDGCAGLEILLRESLEAEQQLQRQQQQEREQQLQQQAGQSAWPYYPLRPPTPPPSTQLYGETPPPPAPVSAKRKGKGKSPAREAGTALETVPEEGAGVRGEVAPEPPGAGGRKKKPRRKRGTKNPGGGEASPWGSRG